MLWKHYVPTPSGTAAVYIRRSDGTADTYYLTSDHLGSTDKVLRAAGGTLQVAESFGAFGARRGSNWTGVPSAADLTAIGNTTPDGFTGHEHLDNIGLIHMTGNGRTHFLNRRRRARRARARMDPSRGRVYDPIVGRFMSVDPIMNAGYGQDLNGYSYGWNSPLSVTDPTGWDEEWVRADLDEIEVFPTSCRLFDLWCQLHEERDFDPFLGQYDHDPCGHYGSALWCYGYGEGDFSGGGGGDLSEPPTQDQAQTQQPLPPCTDQFVGDSLAQSYLDKYGNDAWNEIRAQRDSTVPIAPGTQSEAMRNAEHYLYSYQRVSDNSYSWGPMLVNTVGYNTVKFWTNVAEYYHVANSPWTYSINTTSELRSGFAGANDALFGRPSGTCSVGQ